MKPLPNIILLSYEVSHRHSPQCVIPNLLVLDPKEDRHDIIDLNTLKLHQRLLLDEYLDENTLVVFRLSG